MMIDGTTGFTVAPPEDHQEYAEKIIRVLNDPNLALKMGKAAREQVITKFPAEILVERNIEFYRGIVRSEGMSYVGRNPIQVVN